MGQELRVLLLFIVALFVCSPFDLAFAGSCGNGILETGEECDDQNNTSSDGCSYQCKLEPAAYTNRYVGPSGSNQPYLSVLAAYFDANSGDHIVLLPGTHDLGALCPGAGGPYITKSVTFVGSTGNPADVTLSSPYSYYNPIIDASNTSGIQVSFRHLTFQRPVYSGTFKDIEIIGHPSDYSKAVLNVEDVRFTASHSSYHYPFWFASGYLTVNLSYVTLYNYYYLFYANHSSVRANINTSGVLKSSGSNTYQTTGAVINMLSTNIGTDPATYGITPYLGICGDGILRPGEECDDGNTTNGDSCTTLCQAPRCGNGFLEFGETCDDGNSNNEDSCTTVCKAPSCGDGIKQVSEWCDDGNLVNTDSCSNSCSLGSCGNGTLEQGEECDDANADSTDTCLSSCLLNSNVCALPSAADTLNFTSGSGTISNPYAICNAAQVRLIDQNLSKHFVLGADISLAGFSTAIAGTFLGSLNGSGHSLSNLNINQSSSYQGLFSKIGSTGQVTNLTLNSPVVIGLNYVGALTGKLDGAAQDIIVSNANISGGSYVGGLAGSISNAVSRISVAGQVTATGDNAGSVTGNLSAGSISLAQANTSVQAINNAGGLAGRASYPALISNSSAFNTIIASNSTAGGLVGYSYGVTIDYSYFGGTVTSGNAQVAGGVIGYAQGYSITAALWNQSTCPSCVTNLYGAHPKTTSQLKSPNDYLSLGYDFGSLWGYTSDNYPVLLWLSPASVFSPSALLGTGTSGDPYLISSISDLQALSLRPHYRTYNVYVRLENNLDLAGASLPMLGSQSLPFRANFNGNSKVISNFVLNWPNLDDVGLIRFVDTKGAVTSLALSSFSASGRNRLGIVAGTNNGSLSNLQVSQGTLSGTQSVGAVVGRHTGTLNTATVANTSVAASDDNAGGITGESSGAITRASFSGSVSASDRNAGGVTGYATGGALTLAHSTGSVTSAYNAGGLIGHMDSQTATLSDSYSEGTVSAHNYAGGAAGFVSNGAIARTYFSGAANSTGDSSKDGGTIGGRTAGTYSGNVWSSELCSTCSLYPEGSALRTIAQMKQAVTYTGLGFDFSAIWGLAANSMPTLLWEYPGNAYSLPSLSGDGTSGSPYLISSAADLATIATTPSLWASGVYLRLTADLDLAGYSPPIIGTSSAPFSANFDGASRTISNLVMDIPGGSYQGLFSYIGASGNVHHLTINTASLNSRTFSGVLCGSNAGTIASITLSNIQVSGYNEMGGLCGTNSGTVSNISLINPTVVGNSSNIGGLVGLNSGNIDTVIVTNGVVTSYASGAGGIAGYFTGSGKTLSKAAFSGSVSTMFDNAGGIVGHMNIGGTISQCSASGTITAGRSYAGGILGSRGTSSTGSLLTLSFSNATVRANDSYAGGIVGGNSSYLTISSTFFYGNAQAIAQPQYDGGVAAGSGSTCNTVFWNSDFCPGCTVSLSGTTSMTTSALTQRATYIAYGFDFANVWGFDPVSNYPVHLWLRPEHAASTLFSGGNGTSGSPFLLSTLKDLEDLASIPARWANGLNYQLTTSINGNGKTFPMIGTVGTPFAAVFDGGNNILSNFSTSFGSMDNIGMFRATSSSAQIRNLKLNSFSIAGYNNTGSVVGNNAGSLSQIEINSSTVSGYYRLGGLSGYSSGPISNIVISGLALTLTSAQSGGVCGYITGSSIYRTRVTNTTLTGGSNGGGIVGSMANSTVSQSFFAGTLRNGSSSFGGIAGDAGSGTLENNFSNATFANVTDHTGGISGTQANPTIRYNIAVGEAIDNGPSYQNGGISPSGAGTFNANVFDNTTCSLPNHCMTNPSGTFGRSTALMKGLALYSNLGFDFATVWGMPQSPADYPTLLWISPENALTTPTLSEGSGTSADPYLLNSYADWLTVSRNQAYWAAGIYLRLNTDLDFASTTPPMIGSTITAFAGVFDGNNRTLSNISLVFSNISNLGLFRKVSAGAQVKNLFLANVTVTGYDKVGGVVAENAGQLSDLRVDNINITGRTDVGGIVGNTSGPITRAKVYGLVLNTTATTGGNGGGIAGYASNAILSKVAVQGLLSSADRYLGGIAGQASSGSIGEGYVDGSLSGRDSVGGIVGYSHTGNAVSNALTLAAVLSSTDYAGGISGQASSAAISNCIALGTAADSLSGGYINGPISGWATGTTITNTFWNQEVCNAPNYCLSRPSGVYGRTTSELQQAATFVVLGFDFNNIWGMADTPGYPSLLWLDPAKALPPATLSQGSGTSQDPYLISSYNDFLSIARNSAFWSSGVYLRLDTDIDLSSSRSLMLGTVASPFAAVFDGNNRTISSLALPFSSLSNLGLFRKTSSSAVVKNLTLNGVSIQGASYLGSLVGDNAGTISNVSVNGTSISGTSYLGGLVGSTTGGINTARVSGLTLTGTGLNLGGITGNSSSVTLHRLYAQGSVVTTSDNVGGLVGNVTSTTITEGHFVGSVSANYYAGGIVGYLSSSNIRNSFSNATISATADYAGGISANHGGGSLIANCIAIGTAIDGPSNNYNNGGICGVVSASYPTSSSLWNTTTCTGTNYCKAQQPYTYGRTTAELQKLGTFTNLGFDFSTVWGMPQTPAGYPTLLWLNPENLIPTPTIASGTGTAQDPYLLNTYQDLLALSVNPAYWGSGLNFSLQSNLDLSSDPTPLIPNTTASFAGTFEGNKYTLSNLDFRYADRDDIALFRKTANTAQIKNLNINGVYVRGYNRVSGLIADNQGSVTSVKVTGADIQGYTYVAGIAGKTQGSALHQVAVSGNLTATSDYSGGITGRSTGGSISSAYYSGNFSGYNYVGGISGYTETSSQISNTLIRGTIYAAYDSASAITSNLVGSSSSRWSVFVGSTSDHSSNSYNNSPSILFVSSSTLLSAVWDSTVCSAANTCDDRPVGTYARTTQQMKSLLTYTSLGFDFTNVWGMPQNPGDYPTLLWMNPENAVTLPTLPGSGTIGDPYRIGTFGDLAVLTANSAYWNSGTYLSLTASIDLTGGSLPMVGTTTTPFAGNFDGGNFIISNASMQDTVNDYLGMFRSLASTARVTNLTLSNIQLTGKSYAGILAGQNAGLIENVNVSSCSVYGASLIGGIAGSNQATGNIRNSTVQLVDLRVSSSSVGGVAGDNNGTIYRVSTSGSLGAISGAPYYAGGIVGNHQGGTISQSLSSMNSSSSLARLGGIVGYSSGSSPTVQDCYATGSLLSNQNYVGGIFGYVGAGSGSRNYFAGTANANNGTEDGGISGYGGSFTASFYDSTVCPNCSNTRPGVTALSTASMKTPATYTAAGWNTSIWSLVNGYYPTLLWAPIPPSINAHPAALTINEGDTAQFLVTASGDNLAYQWNIGAAPLTNGTLPSGTVVTGATTPALTLTSTNRAEAGNINVSISNIAGGVTSNNALLTVNYAPQIVEVMSSVILMPGTNLEASISATGLPAPSYTWLKNGELLSSGNTLSIVGIGASHAGTYVGRATNSVGSDDTNPLYLGVITPPEGQSVVAGSQVSFTAGVTGPEQYSYQWQRLNTVWEDIPEATTSTYSFETVLADDLTQFRVRVQSANASATSSSATLSVLPPPISGVEIAASTLSPLADTQVTFTSSIAVGTAPFNYTWQKLEGSTWAAIPGAPNSSSYSFTVTKQEDGSSYRLRVSNAQGTASSNTLALSVLYPPEAGSQPLEVLALAGDDLELVVPFQASPAPTVTWFRSGVELVTGATLSLTDIQPAQAGVYTARATNQVGDSTSEPILVSVLEPVEDQSALDGYELIIQAVVAGVDDYSYQWQEETEGGEWLNIEGKTEDTLSLTTRLGDDGKRYRLRLSTALASLFSNPFTLTVDPAPPEGLSLNLSEVEVSAGGTVDVSGNLSYGTTPLAWSWELFDGTSWNPFPSAPNASSISFLATREFDEKLLRLTVTNAEGSLSSDAVPLTVYYQAIVTEQPSSRILKAGDALQLSAVIIANPLASISWLRSGVVVGTGPELQVPSVSTTNAGLYSFRATNSQGTTNSEEARVSVIEQLPHRTVAPNTPLTITCVIAGNGVYTFQWQKNSGGGWSNINGATAQSLSLTARTTDHGSQYKVLVSDGLVNAESNAFILSVPISSIVTATLAIDKPVVNSGETVSLTAAITNSSPPCSYEWQRMVEGQWLAAPDATDSSSHSLVTTQDDNGAYFRTRISCVGGAYLTNPVALNVRYAPEVTGETSPRLALLGSSFSYSLPVVANPPPGIAWYRDTVFVMNGNLVFSQLLESHLGYYQAQVSNSQGTTSSNAFSLSGISPLKNVSTFHGQTVTLNAEVIGPENYSYVWQESADSGATWYDLSGQTTDVYSFTADVSRHGRKLRLVVSVGEVTALSNVISLSIIPPAAPSVSLAHPDALIADSEVTLQATVSNGASPNTFSWQKKVGDNWHTFVTTTQSSVSFVATATEQGAAYRVQYSNAFGTAVSNVVTLTVLSAPSISSLPARVIVSSDEGLKLATEVRGGYPAPTIRWLRGNSQVGRGEQLTLSGSALLPGQYMAQATNSVGTVNSNVTIVSVIRHLEGVGVYEQESATFSGKVEPGLSGEVLSYFWQTSADGSAWSNISGATSLTLSFKATIAQNGRKYRLGVASGNVRGYSNPAQLLVSQADTASLRGLITANGAPLAGVKVTFGTKGSVTTNSYGEYLFSNLPIGTSQPLWAELNRHSFSPASQVVTLKGHLRVDFKAVAPATLSGVLTTQTGALLIGGRLVLFNGGTALQQVTSNSQGQYRFRNVAPGTYLLRLLDDEVTLAEKEVIVQGDTSVNIKIDEESAITEDIVSLWNTYLGMINVLEIINRGDSTLRISVLLYSRSQKSSSKPLAELRSFTIKPHSQFDLIVNDISGIKANDYGTAIIRHSHKQLDGRMTFYKQAKDPGLFEFAFALPLSNPQRGTTGVSYNTMNPSRAPEEASLPVYNWLTLANAEPFEQEFACFYYNMGGKELKRRTVRVAPWQRVDIDGGHESVGVANAGNIKIVPKNPLGRYMAELVRYGQSASSSGESSFSFALPVPAVSGAMSAQYLPLTPTGAMQEVVEIANYASSGGEIEIGVFDQSGRSIGKRTKLTIGAFAQHQFQASELLGGRSSGSLVVRSLGNPRIYAAATSHFSDGEKGSVLAACRSEARSSYGMDLSGSYNLFLGMNNWLRIVNPESSKARFTLELISKDGIKSFNRVMNPNSRLDLPLHDYTTYGTSPDTYGVVRIIPRSSTSLTANLMRLRLSADLNPDFVFSTPLR